MLPKVGDDVKFTEDILNCGGKRDRFKGKKLNVLQIKLNAITKDGQLFDLFLSDGDYLHKEDNVDGKGNKLIGSSSVQVFEPWGNSFKQSTPDENDRCNKCGAMGELKGMSCVCPSCGNTVWGI